MDEWMVGLPLVDWKDGWTHTHGNGWMGVVDGPPGPSVQGPYYM